MSRNRATPPQSLAGKTGQPITSLTIAVLFLGAALVAMGYAVDAAGGPTPYAFATLSALCSFAFFTRWIQQVDRSHSPTLQFLERVRCYIAHEDAPARDRSDRENRP